MPAGSGGDGIAMSREDREISERKEKAEEHLKQQLAFAKETGPRNASFLNSIIAKNVLHEDLGRFDSFLQRYNLDEDTRDRLIAHARQDAAHALINTITLLEQIRALRHGIILALVFALVIVVLGLSGQGLTLLAKRIFERGACHESSRQIERN
jgi:hypothetical protein